MIASEEDYNRRNINSTAVVRHKNNQSHTSWGNDSESYDLYRDIYQYVSRWSCYAQYSDYFEPVTVVHVYFV